MPILRNRLWSYKLLSSQEIPLLRLEINPQSLSDPRLFISFSIIIFTCTITDQLPKPEATTLKAAPHHTNFKLNPAPPSSLPAKIPLKSTSFEPPAPPPPNFGASPLSGALGLALFLLLS